MPHTPDALPAPPFGAPSASAPEAWRVPPPVAFCNIERTLPPGIDPEYDLRAVVAAQRSFDAVEYARGEALQHRDVAVRALWEAYGPCRVTVETPDAIPHMHCGVCGRLLPVVVRRDAWRLELPQHTPEPIGGTALCANTTAVSGLRDRLLTPLHRTQAPWMRDYPGWRTWLDEARGASAELAQLLTNTGTLAWAEARRAQTRTPTRAAYPQVPGLPQYRPLHTVFTIAGTPWAVDHALVWDVLQDADREGHAWAFSGPHMGLARALHAGVIRTTGGASSPSAGLSERPTVTAYHPCLSGCHTSGARAAPSRPAGRTRV